MKTDHHEIRCLETILDYKMTPMEATAYKVLCLYIDTAHKVFPKARRLRYAKGDPRKTSLFKYCYKLVKETGPKISDKDYPLYVKAQFAIIKSVTNKSGREPNIAPNILVGDKAWNRWLVWKRMYDLKMKKPLSAPEQGINPHPIRLVLSTLAADRKFLERRLKELTYDNMRQAAKSRSLIRWIASGQVSPYYALLSTVLHEFLEERNLELNSIFYIDFDFYQPGIAPEVREFFDDVFSHEKVVGGDG